MNKAENLVKKIQNIVVNNLDKKRSEIKRLIKAELKKSKLPQMLDSYISKLISNELQTGQANWASSFTQIKEISENTLQDLLGERVTKDMLRTADRGIRLGMSNTELSKLMQRTSTTEIKRIHNVVNTTRMAVNRAQVQADKPDAEFYKYRGASANTRLFCSDHLNKVYKKSDIESMDNGQGLPVMYYCGGYNCRHRWVAWSGVKDENGIFVSDSVDKGKRANEPVNKTVEGIYQQNYAAGVAIKKHKPDVVVEMSGNEANKRSPYGDVDLIVDGVKTEVKTPEVFKAKAIKLLITSNKAWVERQADNYVIHFTQEPEEWLLSGLRKRLKYSKSLGVKYKILSNKKCEDLYVD